MRLFIALRPPPSIRQQLIAAMGGVPAARWQDDAQLHCTLRFIGEVDRPQAEDVAAALAAIHAEAPTVRIAGVGRFEHKGRTDTLWAGLAPHDALRHLARKVDQACIRAGLPPERRAYLPHTPSPACCAAPAWRPRLRAGSRSTPASPASPSRCRTSCSITAISAGRVPPMNR